MPDIGKMPGLRAPAFFVSAVCLALAAPAQAQQAQPTGTPQSQLSVQPPPSMRPTPGALELSKLIWSTMAAVDHANRSGNYSVLRDISSQSFQIQNNAARLSEIFKGIREGRIDLSNTLLVPPTYSQAPQMVQEDAFRVQGIFQMRPVSVGFDIYYQWEQGTWKLAGISIQPLEMVSQPG